MLHVKVRPTERLRLQTADGLEVLILPGPDRHGKVQPVSLTVDAPTSVRITRDEDCCPPRREVPPDLAADRLADPDPRLHLQGDVGKPHNGQDSSHVVVTSQSHATLIAEIARLTGVLRVLEQQIAHQAKRVAERDPGSPVVGDLEHLSEACRLGWQGTTGTT